MSSPVKFAVNVGSRLVGVSEAAGRREFAIGRPSATEGPTRPAPDIAYAPAGEARR